MRERKLEIKKVFIMSSAIVVLVKYVLSAIYSKSILNFQYNSRYIRI